MSSVFNAKVIVDELGNMSYAATQKEQKLVFKVFKAGYCLMQVNSIAERGAFCNTFVLH